MLPKIATSTSHHLAALHLMDWLLTILFTQGKSFGQVVGHTMISNFDIPRQCLVDSWQAQLLLHTCRS